MTDPNNQFIEISALGTPFVIPSSWLVKHEWVLSKLSVDPIAGELPWGSFHEGKYFVAVDPACFRWILHFLQFHQLPSTLISQNKVELEAIQKAADFLCLTTLVDYIQEIETTVQENMAQLKTENEKLKIELEHYRSTEHVLQEKNEELETQLKSYKSNEQHFQGLWVETFCCKNYRTHRSGNRCGETTVILRSDANERLEDCDFVCSCGGRNTSRLRNRMCIDSLEDLVDQLKQF